MRESMIKTDWLAAQQCVGMAWRRMRAEPEPPDEAARFRMDQGQEVGRRAQSLYPGGVLIPPASAHASAERTAEAVARGESTIFEAAALAPPFVARADILRRVEGGWEILEVKSKFSDTKDIDELTDDLAYTVMVFQRAEIRIAGASLLLLSRDYRFGDAPERLFVRVDRTVEALSRAAEFRGAAAGIADALFRHDPPDPKLGPVCRECEAFGSECLGTDLPYSVLEIPRLHHKKLRELAEMGILELAAVPEELPLTERQRRVVRAAVSGGMIVEDGLASALAAIRWPCSYLDFESVATTLPLYPGAGCHQQVLTQFSVHERDKFGGEPRHREFLADPGRDCRRELALALIDALPGKGSIFVYTSYEKTRIRGLKDLFPDLAEPLERILDRLYDLERVIENHLCHPDFHGSFSIKKVLPVLAPELSYAGLAIGNGEVAVARFARMALGEITGDEVETTRRQLLEYCKLDTFAMVRLHDVLDELAAGRTAAPLFLQQNAFKMEP
jgi:hypothetical protein